MSRYLILRPSSYWILAVSCVCLLLTGTWAKPPITDGETDPVMLDLDPYMIKALRNTPGKGLAGRWGPNGSIVQLVEESAFQALVKKHKLQLFNGPMIGCVSSDSVKIWVRTAGASSFQVICDHAKSAIVKTTAESDFTGVATIEGLMPFTSYEYSLVLDGKVIKKDHFRFRTAPKTGQGAKFAITFGSGARYVPINEGIWRVMAETRPMAYLGLGDNVYIDQTKHQNVQRLHYYRRMLRQEYRELIASTSIYAVWDDHDMGANDSEGSYGLNPSWKRPNLKVFQQNWNNPFYGVEPEAPGTYHNFRIGDVEVFMTDGRFYRHGPKSAKHQETDKPFTMLGPVQKKWLLDSLKKSTATFKVLASGTMWHADADKGGGDSWAGPKSPFQKERDEIFDWIDSEKISGVILISGDRHRTDIWKTDRPNGYPLYEFLSAKLTNMHSHGSRKEALWSYSGKNERFWGQLDFDTTLPDPTVTFRAINHMSKELAAFTLTLGDLNHKAAKAEQKPLGVEP